MPKIFTTPEEIRAELSRLGDKAHGRKCLVVLAHQRNDPIEAIIHCKDVPKSEKMRWYFCQDEYDDGFTFCAGDRHGKKYAWVFCDDNNRDGVYSLQWLDEDDAKPKPEKRYTINPRTLTLDGATYTTKELEEKIATVEGERDEKTAWLKVAREALKKIS